MNFKHISSLKVIILSTMFVFVMCAGVSARISISNVRVSGQIFNPSTGEEGKLLFQLSDEASVTVKIHDPNHHVVAVVAESRQCYPGTSTVFWNGRDVQGNIIGDDAYYFTVEAIANDGELSRYDPTLFSGGEKIEIKASVVPEGIAYTLSRASRVRIRVGVHDGPLFKTVSDWLPEGSGDHLAEWDGKDESKLMDVRSMSFSVDIQAYGLVANSFIVKGSGLTLRDQIVDFSDGSIIDGSAQQLKGRNRLLSKAATEKSFRSGLHPHAYLTQGIDKAPAFSIRLGSAAATQLDSTEPEGVSSAKLVEPGTIPVISGITPLTIDLEELTGLLLANVRYEILTYIDNQFFMEDEQGYHPYTFDLDTSLLENGNHIIVFNVATLNDQVGSASIEVNVQN